MRILIGLGVVVLLAVVLYRLLRPIISMARQFIRTFRHFQQQVSASAPRAAGVTEKLIQCAGCGTWVPERRSLKSGSGDYCSRECVKRAGAAKRRNSAA